MKFYNASLFLLSSSFPIDEDMQDMKFVDINQFLNVPCDAKIKSEIIVDNENPA